jgi:integrase/recombinase XerD
MHFEDPFESLFVRRSVIQRHHSAPFLKERQRFLASLLQTGHQLAYSRNVAWYLLRAADALRGRALERLTHSHLDASIHRIWGIKPKPASSYRWTPAYVFRITVARWLAFLGVPTFRRRKARALPPRLREYLSYLKSREFAQSSTESNLRHAALLLSWLRPQGKRLGNLRVSDVDNFLLSRRAGGWSLATVRSSASAIRVFLNYAGAHGWCHDQLSAMVRIPSGSRRFASGPKGRPWRDVERLVRSIRPVGVAAARAKAAILLMSHYALRNSEIARLKVSDVDFRTMTLAVRRSKNGPIQRYPLADDVMKAIRHYLKVRPRRYSRIFLSIKAPFPPARVKTFYAITYYRFSKIGLTTGRRGPHAIRHARASQLLRRGTPLREIADFLGHRRIESPLSYVVFDIGTLRQVAAFSLKGLL